jgi:hypothetical protein
MSSITTSLINTANATTSLGLRTGNTTGPSIVLNTTNQITLKANSVSNTIIANTTGLTTNVPLSVNGTITLTNTATGAVFTTGASDVSREIQISGNRAAFGYDGNDAFVEGGSGKGVSLYVNTTSKALDIDPNQSATFSNNLIVTRNINSANLTTNSMVLGNSSISANGFTTLPNGLRLQWGFASVGTTNTTVPFSSTFSAVLYSLSLTPTSSEDVWVVSSNTSALVARADVSTSVYYMAIGV